MLRPSKHASLLVLAALPLAPTTVWAAGEVTVDAAPILGGSGVEPGWNEIVVRVQNAGAAPARGRVEVSALGYVDHHVFEATAPFNVAPGATALVKVPAHTLPYADLSVSTLTEEGNEIAGTRFHPLTQNEVTLVDVSD